MPTHERGHFQMAKSRDQHGHLSVRGSRLRFKRATAVAAKLVTRNIFMQPSRFFFRSFKPFLSLLHCTQIPVVQLWAVWAIHHVCSTDRECPWTAAILRTTRFCRCTVQSYPSWREFVWFNAKAVWRSTILRSVWSIDCPVAQLYSSSAPTVPLPPSPPDVCRCQLRFDSIVLIVPLQSNICSCVFLFSTSILQWIMCITCGYFLSSLVAVITPTVSSFSDLVAVAILVSHILGQIIPPFCTRECFFDFFQFSRNVSIYVHTYL